MKVIAYIILILIILGAIGYMQNEYTNTLANKKVKHPYLENIKKSFGF